MPIDFHDEQNRMTYTTRTADASWVALLKENVDVTGKMAVDIGCGGGIYTKALSMMGAAHVTGVDFSQEMLEGAAGNCKELDQVAFSKGDAYRTNLPDHGFDLVLERALIHHLTDLHAAFKEASRLLRRNGIFVVQDRTPQDCLLPGDANHLRGYFFERHPRLIHQETSRRHDAAHVREALEASGFRLMKEAKLWETRRAYDDAEQLKVDLLQRTGRSILHELTDRELQELIAYMMLKLENQAPPIVEKDAWTVWFAVKP